MRWLCIPLWIMMLWICFYVVISVELVCKLYVKFRFGLLLFMCFGDDEHNANLHDKLMLMCNWCVFGVLNVQYMLYDKFLSVLGFLESKLEFGKYSNGGNHKLCNQHSGDGCNGPTTMHLRDLMDISIVTGRPSWSLSWVFHLSLGIVMGCEGGRWRVGWRPSAWWRVNRQSLALTNYELFTQFFE